MWQILELQEQEVSQMYKYPVSFSVFLHVGRQEAQSHWNVHTPFTQQLEDGALHLCAVYTTLVQN